MSLRWLWCRVVSQHPITIILYVVTEQKSTCKISTPSLRTIKSQISFSFGSVLLLISQTCHVLSKLKSSCRLVFIWKEDAGLLFGNLIRFCLCPRSLYRCLKEQYYCVLRNQWPQTLGMPSSLLAIKMILIINKRLSFANVCTKYSILKRCTLEAIFLGQHMPFLNDEAPK